MKKIISIPIIWLLLLLAVLLLSGSKNYFPYSFEKEALKEVPSPSWLWHLANFDGVHYQNISQQGYITPFQTAFFPLYPLLIRFVAPLAGGDHLLPGLIIPLLSLVGSLILLSRLSKSPRTIIAFLTFPTSFFLISGYTESLFIFLSLLLWYLYKQGKYFPAALVGILLSATRFYGLLLLPVVLIDYFVRQRRPERFKIRSYFPVASFLLLPLGLLGYMLFLKIKFDNPFLFISALSMWQRSQLTFPLQTLYRYLKIFISVPAGEIVFWIAILEFISFWFGLFVSYLLFKARQPALSFYCLAGTLLPAFSGTIASMPRYLLSIFPIFLLPSFIPIGRKLFLLLSLSGMVLQLILFRLFLTGVFVS